MRTFHEELPGAGPSRSRSFQEQEHPGARASRSRSIQEQDLPGAGASRSRSFQTGPGAPPCPIPRMPRQYPRSHLASYMPPRSTPWSTPRSFQDKERPGAGAYRSSSVQEQELPGAGISRSRSLRTGPGASLSHRTRIPRRCRKSHPAFLTPLTPGIRPSASSKRPSGCSVAWPTGWKCP